MDPKERAVRGLGLFSECSAAEIRWIARNADELDVPAGRVLGAEGETVREFVVLMDGVADAGDVLLGPGAYWGAVELLSTAQLTSDVEARTDVRVLVFGVRAFRALIDRFPAVRSRLLADLATRVDAAGQDELSLRAVS